MEKSKFPFDIRTHISYNRRVLKEKIENQMKTNCQIADSNELAKIAACHIAKEMGKGITYKGDSCYLSKDGKFHFVYMDETGTFGAQRTFTANELAYINNMPLWEIIEIDNGGFDDLAILFYEEN